MLSNILMDFMRNGDIKMSNETGNFYKLSKDIPYFYDQLKSAGLYEYIITRFIRAAKNQEDLIDLQKKAITKKDNALSELISIVKIHSKATGNNFAWAEIEEAETALKND